MIRIVLGEPLEDDLEKYLKQMKRAHGVMTLFRDFLVAAVQEGIVKALGD